MIAYLQTKFNIQIIWNYFATSHGKGCVDGIGATVKSVVRNHIKARDCIVNNSTHFVEAFRRTTSTILLEEVNDDEFTAINEALGSVEIYAKAKNVRDISSAHQIRITDDKTVTHVTSKMGYN